MTSCQHCGGTDIEYNVSRGDSTCTSCGAVLEENQIVSSLSFIQDASGSSSMVGQFIPSTGPTPLGDGARGQANSSLPYGKESREVTIARGRFRIQQVAHSLSMTPHHVDAAHRLFRLAVQHNFIQGRKTEHVVAACLYIVCRREHTQHMLIDFSDVLQANLFVLGQTFIKFVRLLSISLPIIDPSLYVHRFVSKLEFESKQHAVATTALRLIASMKRDWIQTGRRPAGICGASIVMAARLHGFRRTQKEVGRIVKICDATLRKRLNEFVETPAGGLTLAEFSDENIDLFAAVASDPPAFSRIEEGELTEKEWVAEKGGVSTTKRSTMKRKAISKSKKKSGDKTVDDVDGDESSDDEDDIDKEMTTILASEEMQRVQQSLKIPIASASGGSPARSGAKTTGGIDIKTASIKANKINMNDGVHSSNSTDERNKTDNVVEEELLTDSDGEDLDRMLLSDKEATQKAMIWTELNKEYLREQEQKRQFEADQIAMGIVPQSQKRKYRKRKTNIYDGTPAETPAEAAMEALSRKSVSTKINYDALKDLLNTDTMFPTDQNAVADDGTTSVAKEIQSDSAAVSVKADNGDAVLETLEDEEILADENADDDNEEDLRKQLGFHPRDDELEDDYDFEVDE